jgi:uncharacterized protein YjaG (DUF416 family)
MMEDELHPFVEKLENMDVIRQRVFIYLTCERMYPYYVHCSIETDFGDAEDLREANTFLYDNIFNQEVEAFDVEDLVGLVNDNFPDVEKYPDPPYCFGIDTCLITTEALQFFRKKDGSTTRAISFYARNATFSYVSQSMNLENPNNSYCYQDVDDHPVMKKEIEMQKGIVNYLASIKGEVTAEDVDMLLALQGSEVSA